MAQTGCCLNILPLRSPRAAVISKSVDTRHHHPQAHRKRLGFFDLPTEIRNSIYTQLLVDEDLYHTEANTQVRHYIGVILIRRFWPKVHTTGTHWSLYLTKILDHEDQPINYNMVANVDLQLQLFYVSKRFYQEASHIFYKKNRFYADSITTFVLFLQDRPVWARCLIEKVSIPVLHGPASLHFDHPPNTETSEVGQRLFALASAAWSAGSDLLPNLKNLDLRPWCLEDHIVHRWKSVACPLHSSVTIISVEHAKILAAIADPRLMRISFFDGHPLVKSRYKRLPIYEALPQVIRQMIERHRGQLTSRPFRSGWEAEGLRQAGGVTNRSNGSIVSDPSREEIAQN